MRMVYHSEMKHVPHRTEIFPLACLLDAFGTTQPSLGCGCHKENERSNKSSSLILRYIPASDVSG